MEQVRQEWDRARELKTSTKISLVDYTKLLVEIGDSIRKALNIEIQAENVVESIESTVEEEITHNLNHDLFEYLKLENNRINLIENNLDQDFAGKLEAEEDQINLEGNLDHDFVHELEAEELPGDIAFRELEASLMN